MRISSACWARSPLEVLDGAEVRDLAEPCEERRRDADPDGLGDVVADDRQAAFGGGGVEGEDAVVVGRALEERRQHHDAVGAAVGGMAGARDDILDHEGRGLHDDLRPAGDDLRAARDEGVGLSRER